jgi:hypothetical protein
VGPLARCEGSNQVLPRAVTKPISKGMGAAKLAYVVNVKVVQEPHQSSLLSIRRFGVVWDKIELVANDRESPRFALVGHYTVDKPNRGKNNPK